MGLCGTLIKAYLALAGIALIVCVIAVAVMVVINPGAQEAEDRQKYWDERVTSDILKDYPSATSIEIDAWEYDGSCYTDGSFLLGTKLYTFMYDYTKNGDTWYLTYKSANPASV